MSRFVNCFFLVFLLTSNTSSAQHLTGVIYKSIDSAAIPIPKTFTISAIAFNGFDMQKVYPTKPLPPTSISQTYYTDHLGMMCKEELKLEKITKLPLRIRLGSKDEVDNLEGKNNHH